MSEICNDLILAQRCRKGPSIPTAPAPPGPNVINNHIAKRAPSRHDNALGRSRGGYGTKACVITDGLGRAIAVRIAPGQAHELPEAIPLLERLPDVPSWVVADRGYTSHAFREHIWSLGARPAIPAKANEAPLACPDWIYNNRNVVERL